MQRVPDIQDIKLLVVDIDGTIAGKSNRLSQRVKQTLDSVKAKGIHIAIATGRMYRSALLFYEEIGSSLPLIAYQGAWIQEPSTNKVHRHLSVSKELAHQLLDYFEQPELRNLLSVHFYINDELFIRELTPDTKAYAKRSNIKPIAVGDLRSSLATNEPTKILALCNDTNMINNIFQHLRKQYDPSELYLTTSVPTFFEAANPSVNKGIWRSL
ncbi:MAG: HAD family phosphatase, partial [Calothrix sp. SM1_7_51]|nr:HAD family phosphatase [Calothrix sp. SM1_7_51]